MTKKCVVCGEEAAYLIKGTSDKYCNDCAEENFADVSLLETIEQAELEAAVLKKHLNNAEDELEEQ